MVYLRGNLRSLKVKKKAVPETTATRENPVTTSKSCTRGSKFAGAKAIPIKAITAHFPIKEISFPYFSPSGVPTNNSGINKKYPRNERPNPIRVKKNIIAERVLVSPE